jgi:hypothetical protein
VMDEATDAEESVRAVCGSGGSPASPDETAGLLCNELRDLERS